MKRPNYNQDRQRREQAKKLRQQVKQQKRTARVNGPAAGGDAPDTAPAGTDGPAKTP